MNIDTTIYPCVETLFESLQTLSVSAINESEPGVYPYLVQRSMSSSWLWPRNYRAETINRQSCDQANNNPPFIHPDKNYYLNQVEMDHLKSDAAIHDKLPASLFKKIVIHEPSERTIYRLTVSSLAVTVDEDLYIVLSEGSLTTRFKITFWDTTKPISERMRYRDLINLTPTPQYRSIIDTIWSALNSQQYQLELDITPWFFVRSMRLVQSFEVKITPQ